MAVEVGLTGPAEITIVNRNPQRGQELVDLLNDKVKVPAKFVQWEGNYEIPADTEVFINATSLGLSDADLKIPLDIKTLHRAWSSPM